MVDMDKVFVQGRGVECLLLKSCQDHWAQRLECVLYLEASYPWTSLGVFLLLFNIITNNTEKEVLISFADDTIYEVAVDTLNSRAAI